MTTARAKSFALSLPSSPAFREMGVDVEVMSSGGAKNRKQNAICDDDVVVVDDEEEFDEDNLKTKWYRSCSWKKKYHSSPKKSNRHSWHHEIQPKTS